MRLLPFISLLTLFISCEDPITINIADGDKPKLVVEGLITDRLDSQIIKLSTTNGFLKQESTPKISNASIQVLSNRGVKFDFSEILVAGTYFSDEPFQGRYGSQYKLQIILEDGTIYESDFQELKPVPAIDSLVFQENISTTLDGFIVTVEARDSPQTEDYYRWKIFRNGNVLGTLSDVFLRSDRLFNGNRFGVDFDIFLFDPGDTCTIEQYSLTENAFDFFRLIQVQAGDVGESSSTAPTQVIGNIRNINDAEEDVLGFFYATSITEATRTVP